MGGDERPTGSTGGRAVTGDDEPDQPAYRPGSARPVYPHQQGPAQSGTTSAFPAVPGTGAFSAAGGAHAKEESPDGRSDATLPVTAVPYPRPPQWTGRPQTSGWAAPPGTPPGPGPRTGSWGAPSPTTAVPSAYPPGTPAAPTGSWGAAPPTGAWGAAAPGGAGRTGSWGAPPPQGSAGGWVGPQQWGPPQPWAPQPAVAPKRPVGLVVLVVALLLLAPIAGGTGVAFYMASHQSQPSSMGSGTSPTGPAVPLGPPQVGPTRTGPTTDPTGRAGGNPAVDGKAISKIVNPSIVDVNTVLGLQNARAAGTGILLNSTGLVLTNNHVIAGATDIKAVSVTSGRTYQASVVGYDRTHDIAVIQLSGASGLTKITLGDSSKVKVDDPIVATGNAGGAGGQPAVVTGTVTGLNQSITATDEDGANPRRLSGLIQIAADIRAGDSGGPLVDKSAHLIGMDTAAAVDSSGESAGTGYAIPVNTAMSIAKQIEAGTSTSTIHIGQTAMLGVSATDAKGDNAGAEVTDFIAGGPARQSGIEVGDVIITVDGHAVTSAADLTDIINGHHPGDQVKVQWVRNGDKGSTTVSLGVGPAA